MTTLIDQLRELESKATPEPWEVRSFIRHPTLVEINGGMYEVNGNKICEHRDILKMTAKFVELLRISLPHFLALVEAVEPFFPRDSLTRCALDSEYNAVIDALKALKEEV